MPVSPPVPKAVLRAAARRFGTPLYVYSADAVRRRVADFEAAFSALPHLVCYALKANPSAALCRLIAREGAGADVVSGGELWRALRAGFPPRRIVFSGVGKTEAEIAAGLRAGILLFNAESEEEIGVMERVARRLKRRLPLSIRVNPDIDPGTHPHITTGKAENKFGIPLHSVPWVFLRAARSKAFDLVGTHIHLGSQIHSPEPYRRALRLLLELTHSLKAHGVRLRYVDIGGGWGVPEDGSPSQPIHVLARALEPMLRGTPLTLVLEPGRSIVAGAGVLLTRVLYRKQSGRKRFVVVDAAMNDLIRPTLYGAKHPILALDGGRRPRLKADVVGPVCESGDFLAQDTVVDWPRPGDLYAVLNAGAYGFSMSSQYNSRPRAAEVLADGPRLTLIRKRETFQDLVRNEL